jgi:mono/diheme cytochrome c family protein
MRRSHVVFALACAMFAAALLTGCERERRRFDPTTPAGEQERVAYDVSQGKRLYHWYNCNGCHGAGGGGSYGPPLADGQWRYGAGGADIVQTIMHGRPGGMPSFEGRIPESQAWQIAAYVRSMSGLLRTDVAPSRADTLSTGSPESQRDRLLPGLDPAAATAPALAASSAAPLHAASAASEG